MIWLLAFFSPTVYFVSLILVYRFQAPPPPAILVASFMVLIPAAALVVCESVVWRSGMIGAYKIGWMLFTLLAMSMQVGILLVIIIEAVTAAISYA